VAAGGWGSPQVAVARQPVWQISLIKEDGRGSKA
jgi:hypothetical protein